MAGEILIRRISLAGWTFDTDWTKIISTDVTPGAYGRFNIVNLTNVGALPALWIYLISGARPA
jgi:hypothetical protein